LMTKFIQNFFKTISPLIIYCVKLNGLSLFCPRFEAVGKTPSRDVRELSCRLKTQVFQNFCLKLIQSVPINFDCSVVCRILT
jgi:hypothetical protein